MHLSDLYEPSRVLFLSINLVESSLKAVYPIMVVENIEIDGIQITANCICRSKKWK